MPDRVCELAGVREPAPQAGDDLFLRAGRAPDLLDGRGGEPRGGARAAAAVPRRAHGGQRGHRGGDPVNRVAGGLLALLALAAGALAPAAVAQERTIELVSGGETGGNGAIDAAFKGALADGSRIFFETTEALLPSDADGANDVYQRAGGTLTLISGGSADAIFAGASADGSRVFFGTSEALAAPDVGTRRDVYERSAAGLTLISGGSPATTRTAAARRPTAAASSSSRANR